MGSTEPIDPAFVLAKHLFGEYCAELDLDTIRVEKVLPRDFAKWLVESDVAKEVAERLGYEESVAEALMAIVTSQSGFARLASIWQLFTLGCRPAPLNPISSVQCVVCLRYRDGQVVTLSSYAAEEIIDYYLTDAALAQLLSGVFDIALGEVISSGVDGLHKKGYRDGTPLKSAEVPGLPIFDPQMIHRILSIRKEKGIVSKVFPQSLPKNFVVGGTQPVEPDLTPGTEVNSGTQHGESSEEPGGRRAGVDAKDDQGG